MYIVGRVYRVMSEAYPSTARSRVNLVQIAPVRTGSLQFQPNLHRCTMGAFSL